ncbi:hypothetical protein ExPUPEC96_02764 [Escherichia coli]|nr:hypothetical protein ExPUPEC96_02764 [Escherichia coli]
MLKVVPSPAGVQVIEIGQSLCFFLLRKGRNNDFAIRDFCGFCCTKNPLVNFPLMIVVGTEDKGAVSPDLAGIFCHGNHIAGINCHQNRKAGCFVQGGGSSVTFRK